MDIYQFKVKDMHGNDVILEKYKGKVMLIVNTATHCGFTHQYAQLQSLYDRFGSKGLEILDFPCNQFMAQAPGKSTEISAFCQQKFGVTFRQFDKIIVNTQGKDVEHPLYTFLKSQKKGILTNNIKWNFTKFLVDREGMVIERFAPTDSLSLVEDAIVNLL